ncbi:MAG: hypothetical protein IJM91_02200 [Lachnospiraceae bacterium]|nr:hypothetical protein [Lachnospiraceae bacterium]
MGLFDQSKGNGMGFAKVPNKQNFTNEDLLNKLSAIEVSFGTPVMGDIKGTQSVMYKQVGGIFDVFVRVDGKNVIMGKIGTDGVSGLEAAFSMTKSLLRDAKDADSSKADHAVDELAKIINQLEDGQEVTASDIKTNTNTSTGEARSFFMKQKAISIKPKFDIFDENKNVAYHVEGNLTRLNFDIQRNGAKVAELKKKLIAVLPEYTLIVGGSEVGKVKKKLKLTSPELVGTIKGKELRIKGDILGFDFDIEVGGNIIGHIDTAQQIWQDCYRITILDESYMDIMIVLAIICDNVVDQEND